jgi:RNA methyltransferase, TrmH family
MKIKRYNKKNNYSFCFGAQPVLDLLEVKEEKVLKVLFKEEGLKDAEVKKVLKLLEKKKIAFEVNDHLIEKIASKENTYVVAVFEKYECELNEEMSHVVLVNPSNPGNLGTIMRNMVAFGFKDIVLIRPAVDIFHPSAVRSAMGSMFHLNFKYFETFEEYKKLYKKHNLYPFMLDAEKEISEVEFKCPFSLVFGNESRGLEKKFKKYGETVFIPHSDFVDSLNLSMSVGIALYVASK